MWKRELIKNKICSIVLILIGIWTITVEGDATFFLFMAILGMVLFFAKENWIQ